MTARFSSASAYLLDAFLIAFVLLFIDGGTDIPLVVLWMALSFITGSVAMLISWRKPYNPTPVLLAAALVMALSLVAGASVGTFLAFTIISLYRLHARFSEIEDGNSGESSFLVLFLLGFTIALILSIFNPLGTSSTLLLPVAAGAIIFYTVSRISYRFLNARRDGAKLWQALAAAGGITLLSAGTAFLVYAVAEETRLLAGSLLGGILAVVLWPFAGILSWLVNMINGMTSEEEMLSNRDNMEEALEQPEMLPSSGGAEFDYTIVAGIAVVLLVVAGILLMRKIKPDLGQPKEEPVAEISRSAAVTEVEQDIKPNHNYDMIDIHEIRRAFREFEVEAIAAEKGRLPHETLREWAQRQDLAISAGFFHTYDKVRYSTGHLAENEALPFLEELDQIKRNLFKEKV
ncbi:hypothetical protein [Planococcus salinarum]|uniref:hypothetical protein n=1 Tax=Planococcus salinarum TaxID=622695 RepID=UPI000E3DBBA5|nr:hypothetical protein [Planococcus salinarum]TAA72158.1 hypothetical protein D2909_08170 [Planococcus salinarum]